MNDEEIEFVVGLVMGWIVGQIDEGKFGIPWRLLRVKKGNKIRQNKL